MVTWDPSQGDADRIEPGVYFYRLIFGNSVLTKKLILLK